jgi:spore protease
MSSIYTDLALETAEQLAGGSGGGVEGVGVEEEEALGGALTVTKVRIMNDGGARKMGRPIGNYVTLESQALKGGDADAHEEIIKVMAENLSALISKGGGAALIIGLGNRGVTPDSLGPKVVSKVLVTRHIAQEMDELPKPFREVAAVAPGVMGTTGIETAEIVKGVTQRVKPAFVIAIDALAARATSRINTTIQISDTGVSPGAGMGNKRKTLDEKTLGVPVIAIGVPTVVDAATLVNDTIDIMLDDMIEQANEGSAFYNMLKKLEGQEKYDLVKRLLDPRVGSLFVTPREVDDVIERLSNIIANALNIALHPGITKEDINRYMY